MTFEQVFEEIWKYLRKFGDFPTSDSVARHLSLSPAQLSRLRNKNANLTNKLADRITAVLAVQDKEYANLIREQLRTVQLALAKEQLVGPEEQVGQGSAASPPTPVWNRSEALTPIEDLFGTLAASNPSLLCVDYRDAPQADSVPRLAEVAAEAISRGLCFAMFQPFGTAEKLFEEHERYNDYIKKGFEDPNADLPHADMASSAYRDLYMLARSVRGVFQKIKALSGDTADRLVLYEAERDVIPLNGIGMQSRLFYANYEKDGIRTTKVFDWVTAPNQWHHFVERDRADVSLNVLRAQFHPITTVWREHHVLPVNKDLEGAYNQREEHWGVRWKNWTPGVSGKDARVE